MNFKKLLYSSLLLTIPSLYLGAQDIHLINIENEKAGKQEMYTDGFAEKISGNDITYNNLWNTNDQAFLVRTTNGKQEISWQSSPVHSIQNGKAHFILLICVDQANKSKKFNLSVNHKQVGSFINFHTADYQCDLDFGVSLHFERIANNSWGDGACFMEIEIPEQFLQKGEPVIFQITGENASENNWFMIFKHKDLTNEIVHRSTTDKCFVVTTNGNDLVVKAPKSYAKQQIAVTTNGDKPYKTTFKPAEEYALLTIKGGAKEKQLSITHHGEPLLSIPSFTTFKDSTYIVENTLFQQKKNEKGEFIFQQQYSDAYNRITKNQDKWWKNAKSYIMVSSHQDIAWMDAPYQCIADRDAFIVTPALALLEKHADYRYDIEDALILDEYLERHPRKRSTIERLIQNGQLGIGASYTQPYEEMQTGEALVRQFYYGKRSVSKRFPGYAPRTYWNVDVPGRTLQMPQILKKSGVQAIQYSRHERGVYNWFSPNSSSVMVFTPGHYGVAAQFLRKQPEEGLEKYLEYMNSLKDYRSHSKEPAVIGMLSAEDMSPAHTYYNWINKFRDFEQKTKSSLPTLVHATSDMFFDALKQTHPVLPSIQGERPNIWLYIHGPSHERALTTYREANRYATSAETFATIASLLRGNFNNYPKAEFDQLWKDLIYADHGWGGNKGYITDSVFYERYKTANRLAKKINLTSASYIASKIAVKEKKGTPVIVFNPLSYSYSSPVKITINTDKHPLDRLSLRDTDGKEVAYQVTEKNGKEATLEFIATQMPSVGYSSYYLKAKSSKTKTTLASNESTYYTLHFVNNQLKQITDKEFGKDLFDTEKFDVGDVFTMKSVGNGAGEFSSVQQPTMEEFDKTSNHNSPWQLQASGAVYSLYCSKSTFKDATIVRYLKLYKQIKRIDFTSSILGFNGKEYREFRQAFPLRSKAAVSYDVPFGTVVVGEDEIAGAAGERYQDICTTIHPRAATNWIGAIDGDTDIKLSSSVTVVDYIDPTAPKTNATILQPILFASRKSCNWKGEFYSQEGDHHFTFSLRSDAASNQDAGLASIAANHEPIALVNPERYANASLPEQLSFFNLDQANLSISTIKKQEDSDAVILRVYDATKKGVSVVAALQSYFPIQEIQHTDLLENNPTTVKEGQLKVGKRAIETFQLKMKK
ncbi:MAG: glycosyl hydrolase-related protein [Bacteroidaceae bacterium]|nr:glycosyl hydrolase-related protein [Bacteroidaceae bacterium]